MVANIGTLVDKARAGGVAGRLGPAQRRRPGADSDEWQFVPELKRGRLRAAGAQDVRRLLRGHRPRGRPGRRRVGRLFVAGAQTDECIRSTLHGAIVRGYDATLVGDAHTTEDLTEWGAPPPDKVIAHTNLYWKYHTAPGRTAGTVETADVDFG